MFSYLEIESNNKAIFGPFKDNPFKPGIKISPLNSVPKRNITKRLVILDLSFPCGKSVNDFFSKNFYLGQKVNLIYRKSRRLYSNYKQKGQECLMFKTDLRRTYRQRHVCPSSYDLAECVWKKNPNLL